MKSRAIRSAFFYLHRLIKNYLINTQNNEIQINIKTRYYSDY